MKKKLLNFGPLLFIFICSFLVTWPLFLPGYFSHHDDLQVMRIFEMRECFKDLQIPCRWVPDMGYGHGFPLFNYYNPLAYYIGGIASFVLGFINAAKLLFFIPLVLAPFAMYFFTKELFGKTAALVSAILYLFAPYRAVDAYVRGAVAESFSIAIIPLVFLFLYKLSKKPNPTLFALNALFVGLFLTSHNITAILFAPLLIFWFFELGFFSGIKSLITLAFSSLLGMGMAAFFLLPAFWEKPLVQTDNLLKGDLDFRAHFVNIKQLFLSPIWGYGPSIPGDKDTLSFQIGWPYWGTVLGSIIGGGYIFIKNSIKKVKPPKITLPVVLFLTCVLFFFVSSFMMHNKSGFIWEKLSLLQYTQFPWRFLSVIIFCVSVCGAFLVALFKDNLQKILAVIIIFLIIILNWNYFYPEKFDYQMTDQKKLSGQEFELQQKAAILDYLPMTAIEPKERAPLRPLVILGKATVTNYQHSSSKFSFNVNSLSANTLVEVPIFYFPNWQVTSNGKPTKIDFDNYVGRISIHLPKGDFQIQGTFNNTLVRTIANTISLISIIILVCLICYGKVRKHSN